MAGVTRTPKLVLGALLAGAVVAFGGGAAWAQEATTTAEDVQANLDNVFVLVAAVLVIFMQAGFALV
jgi:Amt family ammonium transporter